MSKSAKLIKSELEYEKKIERLTVRILNPEAIETASENFTEYMIQLYNEGKINIPQQVVERKVI